MDSPFFWIYSISDHKWQKKNIPGKKRKTMRAFGRAYINNRSRCGWFAFNAEHVKKRFKRGKNKGRYSILIPCLGKRYIFEPHCIETYGESMPGEV